MQTNLFIKSSFESVFLVNGIFLERPKSLIISKQGVTYITVLPLSSALLPYTVKLCGERVASNQELCESVTLSENKMLLLLKPRYNYVYTSQPLTDKTAVDVPCSFFDLLKKGDCENARKLLTPSLNESIDDQSLSDFFSGYTRIIRDEGYISQSKNNYFLISENGQADCFSFTLVGGLIDDVKQNE